MQLDPAAAEAGFRVSVFDTLGSTNAEALSRARAGEAGPLWIVARSQTAGRGRRGRAWSSPPGNLYATLLLRDPAPAEAAAQLSFVAALAVHDAIAPSMVDAACLTLKWPNDLLLDGRKVAGILIEGEGTRPLSAAVGIGVNCMHHPDNVEMPAADLAVAGIALPADDLFVALSRSMVVRLRQWDRGHGFAAIRADWLARAQGLGESIRVRLHNRETAGVFESLDDQGRLVLRRPDGAFETITAGDVALPADGHGRERLMTGPNDELVFAPLGGVGEIGINLALYGFGSERAKKWIVVDFGVSFAGDDLPGIDLVMPDVAFLTEERRNIAGIVLTHAHEDHFGALLDLWPRIRVPVYATPFTAALIESKRMSEPGAPDIKVNVVPLGGRFTLGPFDIELVDMAHSIPESNALIIRTPLGAVLHTGDWKIDPTPVIGQATDEAKLKALGAAGCLALIGDSTNAVREGRSPSEAAVAKTLAELIASAPARVAVTTFASNIARIKAVADAARACEREVVIVGRAMDRLSQVARETGYLDGVQEFRPTEAYGYLPPDKVVALCTGSQGEPRAALARIAQDEHPEVTLVRGDRVIFSSRAIPGNEKAIARVINGLVRQGIEVVTDRTHLVHVSGHPRVAEMEDLYRWVKPKIAIPVHGEALHLAEHARIARRMGVPEIVTCANGDMVRLAPGPAGIVDEVRAGRLYKDGRLVVESEGRTVADRRRLGFAGIVSVAIALDDKGTLVADPEVELIGIPDKDAGGEPILDAVYDAATSTVEQLPRPRRRDPDAVAEAVRRAVRAVVAERWGKKPLCLVHVLTV